jgi:hypothetical protein
MDALSLVARYHFPIEQFDRRLGADPEFIKTRFHEQVHLYQMLTTPYGQYYHLLRRFQEEIILNLIATMQMEYGINVRYPLLKLMNNLLPRRSFSHLWILLHAWLQAEFILLAFEGDWDRLSKLTLSGLLREGDSWLGTFVDVDVNLRRWMQARGIARLPALDSAVNNKHPEAERALLAQKGLVGLDVLTLLENGAKAAEYNLEGEEAHRQVLAKKRSKHEPILRVAKRLGSAVPVRDLGLTIGALIELSLHGPLLPQHAVFRSEEWSIKELHPLFRFWSCLEHLKSLQPIHEVQTDYRPFAEDLCARMNWPTPWKLHGAAAVTWTDPKDPQIENWFQAAFFWHDKPGVFIDMRFLFGGDAYSSNVQYIFSHPVYEFQDNVSVTPDPDRARFYIHAYLMGELMRQCLLVRRPIVYLPYATDESGLMAWHEYIAADLKDAGIPIPAFEVRCEPGEKHLVTGQVH